MSDTVVGDVRHPSWAPVSEAELHGGCFGYHFGTKYGVVFATFRQWGIFGYKNGTFNATLTLF